MDFNKRRIIDTAYQMIISEIRTVGPTKPSVSLSTLAFREEPEQKDYFIFVEESSKGDSAEIKELLTLPVDQPERRTVIDYLTFPLLAAMTCHLTTDEKIEIFLMKPLLLFDHMGRDMAFQKYLSKEDFRRLIEKVPSDVKNSIFHPYTETEKSWNYYDKDTQLIYDRRTYRAQLKWEQFRKARQVAQPTETVLKILELNKQNTKN
jgi:hypothetical protein